MMWAREKVHAEITLFEIVEGSKLRVIAYRPDYIGPTKEEANVGQNLLYRFFAPVGSAVRATQIGHAMFEVTANGGIASEHPPHKTRPTANLRNTPHQGHSLSRQATGIRRGLD